LSAPSTETILGNLNRVLPVGAGQNGKNPASVVTVLPHRVSGLVCGFDLRPASQPLATYPNSSWMAPLAVGLAERH